MARVMLMHGEHDVVVRVADSYALARTAKAGVCELTCGADDHFLWTLSGARYDSEGKAAVLKEFLCRSIRFHQQAG